MRNKLQLSMVKVRQLGTVAISQAILWLWINNKKKHELQSYDRMQTPVSCTKAKSTAHPPPRPLHSYLPPSYIQGTLLCVLVRKIGIGGAEINMEVLLTISFPQALQLYGSAILKCWTTLLLLKTLNY